MADLHPERKKRDLPPWMTAQVAEKKSVPMWRPAKRRKAAVQTANSSLSLPPIRTVYFMNEAELVDVALGILVECHKQEKPLEHTLLLGTDKDQTTQAGFPWASESSGDGEEEMNDAPRTRPSGKQEESASGHKKNSEVEEDEDALKYVREIFFS
ncbi:cell cycle regulator of non-homologous end joining [Dromiciops gliroides]|uniref:cell cycle regulator of non-homologous end joining n=1 Tax=Dromiciops gliroides TaxID=33562 RepID=UPI001CC7112C|nr:cell cycle regulator of non-homologous end joining [Dromiciops gliroides]XP_043823217.1 cell cycle regulator of non-homologous end joining [Dromiciops gliroides]XP_043823218.1 cell cycle regulator of non-homologous end joining [Dromiciops gliroides]XP_043823219.1 cell cycle regulator of non-homologous end joining [Dromiciops gliroides]XP_043823220.1 cell cycle regulator of non-homologous end joining [Dromiciops gliroides]